mmetsp:Transcript_23869/g.60279  ORF Transcript_23869/g.60279 Transcript_23869/m.60279 type:complete len:702 (-) Transcript_23869:118-2223(-)
MIESIGSWWDDVQDGWEKMVEGWYAPDLDVGEDERPSATSTKSTGDPLLEDYTANPSYATPLSLTPRSGGGPYNDRSGPYNGNFHTPLGRSVSGNSAVTAIGPASAGLKIVSPKSVGSTEVGIAENLPAFDESLVVDIPFTLRAGAGGDLGLLQQASSPLDTPFGENDTDITATGENKNANDEHVIAQAAATTASTKKSVASSPAEFRQALRESPTFALASPRQDPGDRQPRQDPKMHGAGTSSNLETLQPTSLNFNLSRSSSTTSGSNDGGDNANDKDNEEAGSSRRGGRSSATSLPRYLGSPMPHFPNVHRRQSDEDLELSWREKSALSEFQRILFKEDKDRLFKHLKEHPHAYYRLNAGLRAELERCARWQDSSAWKSTASAASAGRGGGQNKGVGVAVNYNSDRSMNTNSNNNSHTHSSAAEQLARPDSTTSAATALSQADAAALAEPGGGSVEEGESAGRLSGERSSPPPMYFLTQRTMLRFLYSSRMVPAEAKRLLDSHLRMIQKMKLRDVTDDDVRKNYSRGFCVLAGRDLDGRPMIWIKYKFINPSEIRIPVGVKSTWLSIDAALQDLPSMARGVRLVYDFNGLRLQNVASARPWEFKDAISAVAFCHPSVISSVIFLDAPPLLRHCWQLGQAIVPKKLKRVVDFVSTHGVPDWYASFCDPTQLPRYLGGSYVPNADFHSYLLHRVRNDSILY